MIYAVIDTNVFVAALLTKSNDSATVKVYDVKSVDFHNAMRIYR